jgi:hypothetical protein
MSQSAPTKAELDLLGIMLRYGAVTSMEMFKIKCRQNGIICDDFLNDWSGVVITQTSRGEKMVKIHDLNEVRKILKTNNQPFISHHGQRTRRKWG